ncbi:alpha/beta hydrolase [Alteromonas flava]|uniref:alpha/beta hydrolase n=1 Tax=Alteromonas flava TaxID=2048003 RepID=UPI000C2817B2|nr:alpha/beta hydrolase-fold protein [Alteromonas flava]
MHILLHRLIIVSVLVMSPATASAQQDNVSAGRLDTYTKLHSEYVPTRRVQVWLPEDYSAERKYAVLYMHDGQMLFDATVTWNKQEWRVDEVAAELQASQQSKPFIVVGIDNGGEQRRYIEYLPQKPYQRLPLTDKQHLFMPYLAESPSNIESIIQSDNYLKFLVTELKPFIDKTYSVHTDRAHTFIMGSSMGGLISLYALGEYPEIFGGAGCISTHWVGGSAEQTNAITAEFMRYIAEDLPAPGSHRIYFDYGDQTLDAHYPPLQKQVDAIMQQKGFTPAQWQTLFFPGANHSEDAWQARLDKPLLFLLGQH